MRVVHVIIGLNVGGAELMLKRLLEHSSGSGVDHIVISLTDIGVLGSELVNRGISIICLNIKSPIQYVYALRKLIKLLKKIKPDVVHTWMYHSDLLGGIAAKIAGIKKIIWCVRSTDISKGGRKFTLFVRWICAKISSFVPDVIIYAANASKELHEKCGYDRKKSLVIPNGFDLAVLNPGNYPVRNLRTELGISDCDIVICSIGRYNPVKDHKTFIIASNLLAEKISNVKFLLVGRDLTAQNDVLMSQIRASEHADKFIFLGERKDIPACLASSDIFCLHSVTEGFPNVLGEAMAMKVAAVTTDVGDAAFLLGMPDYVVPPEHPERLAQSLEKLVSLPDLERNKIGSMLRKRIETEFSMDTVVHKYLSIYEK